MRLSILLSLIIVVFISQSVFGQKTEEVYMPAEYDTLYEDVKVKDAYYKLIHHPPVLDTVMVEVTVREPSRILQENWKTTYSFNKKANADSIGGRWVGVRDTSCISPNPEDCRYEIWVPDSPEYDVNIMTNYLGAVWDDVQIPAITIQIPKIVEIRPARVEHIYVPAEYKTIETYHLRKRAKLIIREVKDEQ